MTNRLSRFAAGKPIVTLQGSSMRAFLITFVVIVLVPTSLLAWNEKGHLAIARLAWLKLSPAERAACAEILKGHPHYQEYLTADKPEAISTEEWAFMRAAYWPDWVRSNHSEEFNRPTWHYVTAAYVPPYSKLRASDLPGQEPNVVTQIPASQEKLRCGTPAERAIYLCWLLHLVGDIHQPLHCASQLCEQFPNGDQGGNLAIVQIGDAMPVRLHFAWDSMLGEELELEAIHQLVSQLRKYECEHADTIARELETGTTSADWAREGFANAEVFAYLKGDLRPCHVDDQARADLIPKLSDTYVENAKGVAMHGAVKAASRLARHIASATAP
jgi:hypothetical protein